MIDSALKVLATICARGGSKGVPGKNIRLLYGKPLIVYTLEVARSCPVVSQVVVSTDSDEIAAVAEDCGIEVPFRRPSEMANDSAPKIQAIRHATLYVEKHEGYYPDIIVDLDVGAPMRKPEDITSCVSLLVQRPELDAAVTVYPAERNPYFNMVEFENDMIRLVKDGGNFVCRQDAPEVFSVSGSVFAWRRKSLMDLSATHLYQGRWGGCVIPRERAIDIDHELDFQFIEFILSKQAGV